MSFLTSIPSYGQTTIHFIHTVGVTVYTTVKPIFAMGIHKIQDLWAAVFPLLQAFVKFSMTRTGGSIDLILLAIVPFALSRCVKNNATRVALATAGVFLLAGGAYLLSGLPLPVLPFTTSALV